VLCVLLVAVVVSSPPGQALPGTDSTCSAFWKHLEGLRQVESARCRFQQEAHNAFLDESIIRTGLLWVGRPHFLRWEYMDEPRDCIIVDGNFIWYHQSGSSDIRRGDFRGSRYAVLLRGFFGADEELRKDLTITCGPTDEEKRHEARLVPRQTLPDIAEIVLRFTPEARFYRGIAFTDHYGQVSRLDLSDLQINVSPGPEVFRFEVEPGMRVLSLEGEP
jgi:outer membrane lipoprotein-sorting protein